MKKIEFESNIGDLIGEVIQCVSYFEIDYEGGTEYWNSNFDFDSIDYGLDLEMISGKTFGITWGSEFYSYGISLVSGSLSSQLKGYRKIDVTAISRWQSLIGSKIESVEVVWLWVKSDGLFKNKIHYPQDLILTLSGGKEIFISALEVSDNNTPTALDDNITVFFDGVVAKKYGVSHHV